MLDVNAALTDPLFVTRIDVIRRDATVSNLGRTEQSDTRVPGVYGIVQSEGSSNERRKDYATSSKNISVITRFRLRDQVRYSIPDIVLWQGDRYIVDSIEDMTLFGFIEASCSSIDSQNANPGGAL